jgi:hypothetical protein
MGFFFLGLSDGCVFSDGRKYLSVAMCVRFLALCTFLHMFAILFFLVFFWFFPTMRYPMVWSGSVGCGQILPYVLVLFTPDMKREKENFIAC